MKSYYRRIVCLCMICVLLVGVIPAQAYETNTVATVAEAYVVYDATDGTVLLQKDMDTGRAPASITKIMTAYLACLYITDWDQTVTFSQEALDEMTPDSSHLPGQMAMVGEQMTVREVMYGMFLSSANECAAQLAITVAGSREAFAELMNEKAMELGCSNTHFVNAHGLDAVGHFTSPHDMALIMAAALENPTFRQMATTKYFPINPTAYYGNRLCEMGHKMVNGLYYQTTGRSVSEVFAGKTGRTAVAGRTLVTACMIGGHEIIIVIMHSDEDNFYDDTYNLIQYTKAMFKGSAQTESVTTTVPETTVEITTAAPETAATETAAPETAAPETAAPETTSAPETTAVPETVPVSEVAVVPETAPVPETTPVEETTGDTQTTAAETLPQQDNTAAAQELIKGIKTFRVRFNTASKQIKNIWKQYKIEHK